TYHITLAFRLRGNLRTDLIRDCLSYIVARHDSLRMTFHSADGVPFQITSPPTPVDLPVVPLSRSADQTDEQAVQEKVRELSSTPFDLERGPLYRHCLLELADDDYVLVQILHHIITDGWSRGVVVHELNLAYTALLEGREPDLGDPGLAYSEHATAQR